MRKILLFVCSTLVVVSAHRNANKPNELLHHQFEMDVMLKATPAKNQENSSLCWAYAMLGTIESEQLMMGDSVNLSVDYLARMLLKEQARESFSAGDRKWVLLRGTVSMTLHLLERYGMLHEDTYNGKQVNYNALAGKMQLVVSRSASLQKMDGHVDEISDAEVGFMSRFVFSRHAEYTPKQFAHSVCLPHEYLSLTSFTYHLYGHSFALEIPDNRCRDVFTNVSLDTLMTYVRRALQTGHPVCWEGDISGPGFSSARDVAKSPNEAINVTPAARQEQFGTLKTTNDHYMVLVRLAHDKRGDTYYITKNSWGKSNLFGGYMYLSDGYLCLKTVTVYMSQAAYGVR